MQWAEYLFLQKKEMAAIEKRNWGLGFLLSIVLAAGMIVNSYVEYVDAQRQCYDCFGEYDF